MNEQAFTQDFRQDTYAPYRREALTCLIIDTVVALSLILLLLLAGAGWFLVLILPLYAALTVLINYRNILRARREARENAYVTASVDIVDVKLIRAAAGYGGAVLRELYPKSLRAGRYRILCRREDNGERVALVCVMSEEKSRMLREAIDRGQLRCTTVSWGAYSKILRGFEGSGGLSEGLNRKF